jgi:PAS domain S-box-containing protein
MTRFKIDYHSLPVQMILGFVALVVLTAVAVGVPAIWLIRNQMIQHAWAQVEQGSRTALTLYAYRHSEIVHLATLAAERPTLRQLLAAGEWQPLAGYLRTLQTGARLDLVLVCDPDGRSLSERGAWAAHPLCSARDRSGFFLPPVDSHSQVWLFASEPVEAVPGAGPSGFVVMVGIVLEDVFARQMRDQTGLEHALLTDGVTAAASLGPVPGADCRPDTSTEVQGSCRTRYVWDGGLYYAQRVPLLQAGDDPGAVGLEAEVALPVSNIVTTQSRLVRMLLGSMLLVAVTGSVVAAFLARRIGWPLARLAEAAAALSRGELASPVTVDARVREVALLAQALEGARVDLARTLDQLRQEKSWTDHLLEAIVEGIVTLDRNGRITFFSQGAERITGWKREQVLNRSCDQVFRPSETEVPFSQLIPAPGRRGKIAVELPDGRRAVLAVTGARLFPPEGADARVALVFRDVSEEEAVHRLLGHFLANVAHEFRTPLAAVAASVELLLDQAPDLSAAELSELLTSLHLGVLGLQTLVDNLLEGASIEAGHFKVSPRPSDLSEIIAAAIRMIQPLLDKHGQRLTVELPAAIPVVQADPRRTVQVLVNLLSNASKYGPDEGEILISAVSHREYVRIAVADRGPGIPAAQHQEVFHRFTHLGTRNHEAQYGVGLGLSVVKAVVEAHGGHAGVEDRPGGGAIFWFSLLRVGEA